MGKREDANGGVYVYAGEGQAVTNHDYESVPPCLLIVARIHVDMQFCSPSTTTGSWLDLMSTTVNMTLAPRGFTAD